MTTLTPPKPASLRSAGKLKSGPGAERINQAYEEFLNAAVPRGLIVGQMLLEQRYALMSASSKAWNTPNKGGEDHFAKWIETNCPKISVRTAYNWMRGAENAAKAVWPGRSVELIESGYIEIESEVVPISQVLETTEGAAGTKGELKQAYFDFAADKTMKDCIGGVFLDGNDPTAITRAHNGRTAKGAGGGGDRKEFEKFFATKLKHQTTFLNTNLTPVQRSQIIASTAAAHQSWPRWYLEASMQSIKDELKLDDAERAARKGELL